MEDYSQYNGEGTELRKVQLRLVNMLTEIDRVCRKHDIRYWIDFGTLLGAVRHKGFIPWDDDVDVSMPTEDLRRFLEIAPKEFPDNLFLQTKATDPSFRKLINKVRDRRSLFITPYEDFGRDYQKGIFIDLFEIKPYPTVSPKLQKGIMRWYMKTSTFFVEKQDVSLKNHLATLTFPIIKAGLDLFWGLLNLGKKDKLGYEKHFSVYGNSYPQEMVFPLKEIQFEGKTFLGPANPDAYLTSIYGDYMKIPPKEKWRIHTAHVEFFS